MSPQQLDNLHYAGISDLGKLIREQRLSPVSLVRSILDRIARLNPKLNAFITILNGPALVQARAAEAEIRAGKYRGPLHGIPVGIKDMYDTAGIRTTAAFEKMKDRVPAKDAVAVSLLKEAGAILVGKMNLHELAMGTTSAVSYFGAVHNPWNAKYVAGGSSGGSAAAVAAGLCYATLDTDAIGSCRLPASCCGVVGFKGSYGLIDNRGILEGRPVDQAIIWLAHGAVTTRSVADLSLVLSVLAGPPRKPWPAAGAAIPVGVATNFAADAAVRAAFDSAVDTLRGLGHTIQPVLAPLDNPGFDVKNLEADRKEIAGTLFKDVRAVLLPTTAATTPTISAATPDPQAVSARNTLFANYYGLPAISVLCGFDRKGLPLGLQIVGGPGEDATVLRLARQYQEATEWGGRHPVE